MKHNQALSTSYLYRILVFLILMMCVSGCTRKIWFTSSLRETLETPLEQQLAQSANQGGNSIEQDVAVSAETVETEAPVEVEVEAASHEISTAISETSVSLEAEVEAVVDENGEIVEAEIEVPTDIEVEATIDEDGNIVEAEVEVPASVEVEANVQVAEENNTISEEAKDEDESETEPEKSISMVKLQYYNSRRIVLQRDTSSRNSRITNGRLIERRGRLIEQIVIRSGTPGIAVDWGDDWIAISFAKNTSIIFEAPRYEGKKGRMKLASLVRRRKSHDAYILQTFDVDGQRRLKMGDQTWRVVGNSKNARLMVRKRELVNKRRRRRVLRGRRL